MCVRVWTKSPMFAHACIPQCCMLCGVYMPLCIIVFLSFECTFQNSYRRCCWFSCCCCHFCCSCLNMAHIFGHQSCSVNEIVNWFVHTHMYASTFRLQAEYPVLLHAIYRHAYAYSLLVVLNSPSPPVQVLSTTLFFFNFYVFCRCHCARCYLLCDATCCCLLWRHSLCSQVFAYTRILRFYFPFSISSIRFYKYLFCLQFWHVLLSLY